MDRKVLRILFICNNTDESKNCEIDLRAHGMVFLSDHVGSKTELAKSLKDFHPDIVLADSTLKAFEGISIVEIIRQKHPGLPVIFVTDSVGEESIAEMFKNGGSDVVFKDHLSRLAPTIKRVMRASEQRQEKLRAEKELKEKERFLANVFESIQDGISVLDKDMNIIQVNHTMEKWYKHAMPLVGRKCYEAYHGRHKHCDICPSHKTLKSKKMEYELNPRTGPDGNIIGWFDLYSFPLIDDQTGELKGVIEYVRDITERKKAEEALAESEKKYRLIVETATEGIFTIDKGDVIKFTNKRICEMLGCSCETLIGKEIFELMDEDWKATARSDIESLRRGGRERHDFKFKRTDGTDLWAIVSATPIFDELHQYAGALYMVTGISERKRAEEASRAVENKYRRMMELSSDAIFIADPETGTILDANKRAEEIVGLPLERMIGISYLELHPKDNKKFERRIFEDAVRTGKIIISDTVLLRSDGKIIPVEIRVSLIGIGGKKVVQALFRDMTEKIAAEEKLCMSEERLKAILNNSKSMIYGRGLDGRYIFINKAFENLLHLKEKRVLENTPYDIFTKDIADMFQKTDVQILDTGESIEVEELIPLPDGIHTYASQKFPLKGGDGKVYAMCSIATDITRYKNMEEELSRKNEELRHMIERSGPDLLTTPEKQVKKKRTAAKKNE
jgi:PAS domain S-box-containing protein